MKNILTERVNINPDKFNELKDLLNKDASGTIWPNSRKDSIPPNTDVYPLIKLCLDGIVSITDLVVDNLSLFKNKRSAVNLIDQMNISSTWYVNNTPLSEETPNWCDQRVNVLLTKKYTSQSAKVSANLVFKAYGNVLFRYDGDIKFGVHYRIKEDAYGISITPDLKLSYVLDNDELLNYDNTSGENLLDMIDFESNKYNLEFVRKSKGLSSQLINELYDFPFLKSKNDNSGVIPADKLSKLCLLCYNGNLISSSDKETNDYIKNNKLSSKVELDGLLIFSNGVSVPQKRLLNNIYNEINKIETYDTLFDVVSDLKVSLVDENDNLVCYQTCTLKFSLSRVFLNVSTLNISKVNLSKKINRFSELELEYLERDNAKYTELVSPLDKSIRFSKIYKQSILRGSGFFFNSVLSIFNSLKNYIYSDLENYSIDMILDNININKLTSNDKYIKELFDEVKNLNGDELEIGLSVNVYYTLYGKSDKISSYSGTLNIFNDENDDFKFEVSLLMR